MMVRAPGRHAQREALRTGDRAVIERAQREGTVKPRRAREVLRELERSPEERRIRRSGLSKSARDELRRDVVRR